MHATRGRVAQTAPAGPRAARALDRSRLNPREAVAVRCDVDMRGRSRAIRDSFTTRGSRALGGQLRRAGELALESRRDLVAGRRAAAYRIFVVCCAAIDLGGPSSGPHTARVARWKLYEHLSSGATLNSSWRRRWLVACDAGMNRAGEGDMLGEMRTRRNTSRELTLLGIGRAALWLSLAWSLVAGIVACTRSDSPAPTTVGQSSDARQAGQGGERNPEARKVPELGSGRFALLPWTAEIVDFEYFDASRIEPRFQFETALDALGAHLPEFFASIDDSGELVEVRVGAHTRRFTIGELGNGVAVAHRLREILEFVQAQSQLDDEEVRELEYAAVNGFLSPLDPHTVLLNPKQHVALGVRTRGRFGGIGAEIVAGDRRIRIVRVLPGTPAEKAGLLDDDLVLRIDGRSTVNMSARQAQEVLRGAVGTEVSLEVRRGKSVETIAIERGMIDIPAVNALALSDGVGYVQLTRFQEDAAQSVADAVKELVESGSTSLVFDLRHNSGGLLTQATKIVDLFVREGELVSVLSASGRESDPAERSIVVPESMPLVVLIDQNSASAAEIVSGSLKNLGRALVVGRTSFGKGTVQRLRTVEPEGRELSLKLTIAEYRVANDGKIRSRGVTPDLPLFPVRFGVLPGVGRLYDAEVFEEVRERARAAHLPSARHDRALLDAIEGGPRPLRYLDEPRTAADTDTNTDTDTDEVGENEGKAESGKTDEPEKISAMERRRRRIAADPEIEIAARLALRLRGTSDAKGRAAALAETRQLLEVEEDRRIVAALAEDDIDWRGQLGVGSDLGLEVSARIVSLGESKAKKSKKRRLRPKKQLRKRVEQRPLAGEPFTIAIRVRNPHDRRVERINLRTRCEQSELDGIELAIGALAPGAEITRELQIQMMPWRPDLTTRLELVVHAGEPDTEPDGQAHLALSVRGRPQPDLAFDYWIVDDPKALGRAPKRPELELLPDQEAFTVAGNGDGSLQPGERVLLAFRVHNRGKAIAEDLRVLVRNRSGAHALLEEGELDLGSLVGGGSKAGAVGLAISPRAIPGTKLDLESIVGDARVRVSVARELPLVVVAPTPEELVFERGRYQVVPATGAERTSLWFESRSSAPVVAQLPRGQVVDVVARRGPWAAIELRGARRLWLAASDLKPVAKGKSRRRAAEPKGLLSIVDPPHVQLSEVSLATDADSVALRGDVTDDVRVRDVVVHVRVPGSRAPERKVYHRANPSAKGEHSRSLAFSADVPLEPGSNLVTITTRDEDKVAREKRIWVYRHE